VLSAALVARDGLEGACTPARALSRASPLELWAARRTSEVDWRSGSDLAEIVLTDFTREAAES
jgi:hypothetical protein